MTCSMKKQKAKAKKIPPQKDVAWFEQKVAELGARLNKLPAARQELLEQELAQTPVRGRHTG
jgi:hypothetical protein